MGIFDDLFGTVGIWWQLRKDQQKLPMQVAPVVAPVVSAPIAKPVLVVKPAGPPQSPFIAHLITLNQMRWNKCVITPSRLAEVNIIARNLVSSLAKARYQDISELTKVPWWVIAVIHERECSQNWMGGLAQGDPWNQVSIHQPRGIGPFKSFQDAAVYALTRAPPYAARWSDWSAGGTLTLLEQYNGLGYEQYNEPSPYNFGATNIEQPGKYIADGRYSATTWDTQLGCAAMLKAMMVLDPSIKFDGAA